MDYQAVVTRTEMLDRVHLWNIASVTSLSYNFFKFELNTYCLSAPYVQQGSLQGPASTVRQMMEDSHLHGKLRKSNCNYASPMLHIFSRSIGLPKRNVLLRSPHLRLRTKLALGKYHTRYILVSMLSKAASTLLRTTFVFSSCEINISRMTLK